MPLLDREEYIEQAYFFRVFRERLDEDLPSQHILMDIKEELLATTKLPMAVDLLKSELLHTGRLSIGMARLPHYFAPFQTFVMEKAEEQTSKFDQRIGLQILEREAEYLSREPTPGGLFIYQFESISRNRLGYDRGMTAIAGDPIYDERWREWILKIRHNLGTVDFSDLIFYRSEAHVAERSRLPDAPPLTTPILFGRQEGRIAKANRGKDPLYLFAALQRQLGYPAVPRPKRHQENQLPPQLEIRLQKLEKRLQLLESETKGQLDLSEFYTKPFPPDDPSER